MEKVTKRKVFAASASAALVASAVIPAATFAADANFTDIKNLPGEEQDAINALVSSGVLTGKDAGIFDPYAQMKRSEAAAVVARILDLDVDNAPSADFDDVNSNYWGAKYINAAVEAGVMEGKGDGKFDPEAPMKRSELAQIVVKTFGLTSVEDVEHNFNDIPGNYWGKEAIETLYAHGLIKGKSETKFAPEERMQRNHVALLVKRAVDYVGADPIVQSVTATNQTTLQVSGTGLDKLTKEDVTVENNTVTSITANSTGTSATIILGSELVVDEVTTVTIGDKEFNVTYSIDAKEISVVETTYDDDTKDQYVAITVDGKTINAQELINAGYTVKFEAFNSKAARSSDEITDELFAEASGGNDETGKLSHELYKEAFFKAVDSDLTEFPTAGLDIYVKVTAIKGTEVVTSDIAKVKIQNIDLAANGINDFVLTNKTAAANLTSGFEYNSHTLVTGEVAEVSEITVKAGSEEEDIETGYTLDTSDKSVFTVDGNEITAQGPGTATLTIKYGGITKTQKITVTNDAREVKSVKLASPNLKVGKDQTVDSKIYVLDQYGDPMESTVEVVVSNKEVAQVVTDATGTTEIDYEDFDVLNDPDNETKLFVKGLKQGSTTVTFRDAAGVKIGTTTLKVDVSENTDLNKFELKVDSSISDSDVGKVDGLVTDTVTKDDISESLEIDIASNGEKYVKIDLKAFNAQGYELDSTYTADTEYEVKVNPSRAGVIGNNNEAYAGDGFIVVEAGDKTGSATIEVTSTADSKVRATIKVNVVDKGYNVTGVTFKAFANPTYSQTINYEDVLNFKDSANDPVIEGLKLTKDTSYPIRLALDTAEFYIDKNANGIKDTGERVVGELEFTSTGTFKNSIVDIVDGIDVVSGDDGTLLFKVVDNAGKVIGTKAIDVDF